MAWRQATIRGKKVWARCSDDGALSVSGGRVEIRYGTQDTKAYHASVRNLHTDDTGDILPDAHCAEASAAPPRAKAAKKTSKKRAAGASPPTAPSGDEVLAYCDGACSGNPGPAGLGAVMIWDEERQELSEYLGVGTNNIAELRAIQRVAEAMPDPTRPLRLYTDSKYSIGVLTQGWKAKANREIIAEVKGALSSLKDAELIHVRGHAGVELNERADELAREAVEASASSGWVSV